MINKVFKIILRRKIIAFFHSIGVLFDPIVEIWHFGISIWVSHSAAGKIWEKIDLLVILWKRITNSSEVIYPSIKKDLRNAKINNPNDFFLVDKWAAGITYCRKKNMVMNMYQMNHKEAKIKEIFKKKEKIHKNRK